MRLMLLALVPALALPGCVNGQSSGPVVDPMPIQIEDACGAAGLQNLVGQDASVLDAMTLPDQTRVLRPGMVVTMDYSPTRLNIVIDENEKIRVIT